MTRRWPLIVVLTVVVLAASVALVLRARAQQRADLAAREDAALEEINAFNASRSTSSTTTITEQADDPDTTTSTEPEDDEKDPAITNGDLLVVSTVPGKTYGSIEIIEDDGTRVPTGIASKCDRIHAGGGYLVCMSTPNFVPNEGVAVVRAIVGNTTRVENTFATGLPSRARVAPDGSWASITSFVTGHSYLEPGQFATQTVMFTPGSQGLSVPAEMLKVSSSDARYHADDGNWWGGTPIPGEPGRFLMTYGTGDGFEVMKVDAQTNTAGPDLPVGGCPSISPDGHFVVFKAPVPGAKAPALLVLHDLTTGEERVLGEDRFVDDQPEWLDDHTLAYTMVREDTPKNQPASDIWSLDIADGAKPKILVPFATSPVRYRDTNPDA